MWKIKKILQVIIACIMVISSMCVCQKEKVKVGVIDGVIREKNIAGHVNSEEGKTVEDFGKELDSLLADW